MASLDDPSDTHGRLIAASQSPERPRRSDFETPNLRGVRRRGIGDHSSVAFQKRLRMAENRPASRATFAPSENNARRTERPSNDAPIRWPAVEPRFTLCIRNVRDQKI